MEADPVLIVGSGPAGMLVANELLRRGVRCRLIDKAATPTFTSRAFTVHARTLEMLEHVGVAHRFVEQGEPSPGFTFNFKGFSEQPRLDFRRLDNTDPRYRCILKVSQTDTERMLREHLEGVYSCRPEWNTELTELEQVGDGVRVRLQHLDRDGFEEVLTPRWLVACDGVHSRVRKALGLSFTGRVYRDMVLQMMDAPLENYAGDGAWINYYMEKDFFLTISKLPGHNHRLLLSDAGESVKPGLPRREVFQEIVDRFVSGATLHEPLWATQWTIRANMAQAYRHGNIFLCGDATHIHSPAGGQGMNACMQDGFNLGWKLAMVIRGEAQPSILDSYEAERRPIAEQVTAGAHAMHQIIMAHGTGLENRFGLTEQPGWHDEAINRISGLSHNYRGSAAIPEGPARLDGPRPGDRAPDATLVGTPERRIFDLLRHPRFTLMLMPASNRAEEAAACREIVAQTSDRYNGALKCVVVSASPIDGFEAEAFAHDETGESALRYGRGQCGRLFLVRPDGYLGFVCQFQEREHLYAHLRQVLT
jgi:2-polyprenyl-6-methoxyphenol hydroxylase-like FAD-dependent oxidoreductase